MKIFYKIYDFWKNLNLSFKFLFIFIVITIFLQILTRYLGLNNSQQINIPEPKPTEKLLGEISAEKVEINIDIPEIPVNMDIYSEKNISSTKQIAEELAKELNFNRHQKLDWFWADENNKYAITLNERQKTISYSINKITENDSDNFNLDKDIAIDTAINFIEKFENLRDLNVLQEMTISLAHYHEDESEKKVFENESLNVNQNKKNFYLVRFAKQIDKYNIFYQDKNNPSLEILIGKDYEILKMNINRFPLNLELVSKNSTLEYSLIEKKLTSLEVIPVLVSDDSPSIPEIRNFKRVIINKFEIEYRYNEDNNLVIPHLKAFAIGEDNENNKFDLQLILALVI